MQNSSKNYFTTLTTQSRSNICVEQFLDVIEGMLAKNERTQPDIRSIATRAPSTTESIHPHHTTY
jgi:hypothetical protein